MPQKATDLHLPTHLKVLAYGDFAAGKTTFATTFPKPILFFDFDDGRQTYAGVEGVEYEIYKEEPGSRKTQAYNNFRKDLAKFEREPEHGGYKTFVLDSTTFLQDAIQSDIIAAQGATTPGEGITLQQWQIITNRFADVFRKIKTFNANFVIIGHSQMVQDEMSGEIKTLPMMVGKKFPAKAPLYFDEVYRVFYDEREKDGPKYKIQTSSCRKYSARSRLNQVGSNGKLVSILDQYEPADFEHIMAKVERARGHSTNK